VGDIQKKYLNILRTFTQKSLPSVKKDYDPVDLLESAGFSDTSKQIFSVIENLLVEQTLSYIQSTSLWNLVPEKRKARQ